MSITVDRAVRLVHLRDQFLAGSRHTARDLAQRYGVSQRTIERDLLDLQSEPLRVPLVQDIEWRWMMQREVIA